MDVSLVSDLILSIFPFMTILSALLMIITGYIGFSVAYYGLPTDDKWAKILIFSLPYLLMSFFSSIIGLLLVFIISTIITVLSAIVWTKWVRKSFQMFLRKFRISNEDGYHSILNEMNGRMDISPNMMYVHLKSGETLGTDLRYYNNEYFGNGTVDRYGNIRMYVIYKGKSEREPGEGLRTIDPISKQEGHPDTIAVTYIPKDEVKSINYYVPLKKSKHNNEEQTEK